jgi:cobalt/nickel transport system ATP-binding protein
MAAVNALDVRGLRFRYADGTDALHDVSFHVAEGERVALVGPNGAGKSTLLLHLNGLLPERPPREPAVRVFNVPVTRDTLPEIRARVGFLFQDPDDQLFCATVWEDVAFGPRQRGLPDDRVAELAASSLAAMGLTGFDDRPPHRLSRGEKQRVCLAGLLACEPKVLVLDEPTTHLDPRGRRELCELLGTLPVAQVVATHDLELAVRLCARAILLDGGRIVAEGPTAEILGDEALMQAHGLEKPHVLSHRHPHE